MKKLVFMLTTMLMITSSYASKPPLDDVREACLKHLGTLKPSQTTSKDCLESCPESSSVWIESGRFTFTPDMSLEFWQKYSSHYFYFVNGPDKGRKGIIVYGWQDPDDHQLFGELNGPFKMDPTTSLLQGWQVVPSHPSKPLPRVVQKGARKLEFTGDSFSFYRDMPQLSKFNGRKVYVSFRIKSNVSGISAEYWDGKNPVTSPEKYSLTDNWQGFNFEFTVNHPEKGRFARLYLINIGATKNVSTPVIEIEDLEIYLREEREENK